jgi:hypothetical protein
MVKTLNLKRFYETYKMDLNALLIYFISLKNDQNNIIYNMK